MEPEPTFGLRCFLFGAMAMFQGTEPLALPSTEAARSLLAYLLLHRRKRQARLALAGIFWPEMPESEARQRLSQALYQVRRALPELIEANAVTLSISPEVEIWVDVDAFRWWVAPSSSGLLPDSIHSVDRGHRLSALQQAVRLYKGDFLEGFYDDWVLTEREHLQEQYLRALEELVGLEKSAGRYLQALEHALRMLEVDALLEPIHREVMRLQFALKRPEDALKQYKLCCNILKEELDVKPEDETIALAQEIASQQERSSSTPYLPAIHHNIQCEHHEVLSGQVPLVGRTTERAQLLAFLQDALDGFGGIVLLEGEPGVGKTRLVQELARDAEWRSMQVLRSGGRQNEGLSPFNPLVEALGSDLSPLRVEQLLQLVEAAWLLALLPLFPKLSEVEGLQEMTALNELPPEQERQRLFDAFAQVLVAWGAIKPMLLIIEDVHWVDEDSLDVLSHLAEPVRHSHVLIVCTYRGDEARTQPGLWQRLETISRVDNCHPVALGRLDLQFSNELVRRILKMDKPVDVFAAHLYQETGGNPLFILETIRALRDEGVLFQDSDGSWSTDWDGTTLDYRELPASTVIEQTISRRLLQIPPDLRALLDVAAAIGSQVDIRLLQASTALEPRPFIAGLQTLVQRQLLEETQRGYRFSHEKVRQVVYAEIEANERIRLHQRIFQALIAQSPEQAATLVSHATLGELWEQAVEYHLQAGKKAQTLQANQTAWDHFTQALDTLFRRASFCESQKAELAFELYLARSSLAWIRGDVPQQEADIQELVRLAESLADPKRKAEALIQYAYFLCNTLDEYEKARQEARTALELANEHTWPHLAAQALQQLGVAYQRSDDYQSAEQALKQAIEKWKGIPGERIALAEACIYLAQVYERSGDLFKAKAQAQMAANLAQESQSLPVQARACALMATLAYRENDFQAAIQHNQEGLELARQIGHQHNQAVMLCNLGFDYWALGDYANVIEFTRKGLEIYRRISNRRGVILCCDNLSALYIELGQYEQAQEILSQGLALASQIDFTHAETQLLINQGRLYLEQGDLRSASRIYRQAAAAVREIPYLCGGVQFGLGVVRLAKGDYRRAGRHFERAVGDFEAAGERAFATAARSYLAIARLGLGEQEDAARLSSQAIAEMEAAGGGEHVQDIYLHRYEILAKVGQIQPALDALQRAYQAVQSRAARLPDTWRDHYLYSVSINRRILTVWEQMRPRTVQVRLARGGVPSGRPLRLGESVQVTWTIETPDDAALTEKGERRKVQVMRLLDEANAQGAAPTVDDLANALQTSRATIKRDLAALRQAGHVVITRGGRT
ncbi:MAG: AAA family ATPase [Chloroflexota bacterium]